MNKGKGLKFKGFGPSSSYSRSGAGEIKIAGFGRWLQGRGHMEILKKVLSDRRFHRLAGGMLVLVIAAVLLAWRMGVDEAMLKEGWKSAERFLMDRPWWLFAGLVVLPGLPVPTSALMFLAGTVWRDRPIAACGICLLALALNMSWTYWVAARPGRGLVEKVLSAGTLKIPVLPKDNHLRAILLLRLTPGVPLFFQNYLLGFLHVPFRLYLPVSLACSGLISCGFVLIGAGVAGGEMKKAIIGVSSIIAGLLMVQMLRQKLQRKS